MLRAGELARDDGDLVAARAAFERALGLRIGPGQRTSLRARIARLDALVSLDRSLAALEALAVGAPSTAIRADVVGVVAETLADAGRYDDALSRLAVPDDATPAESDGMLARADALLARWFERLAAADDVAGIVTLYAKHRTVIDTHADGATARRIANALERMALPEAALRLLRVRDRGDDPALSAECVRLEAAARGSAGPPADDASSVADAADARRVAERTAADDPVVRRALALVDATSRFGVDVAPPAADDAGARAPRSDRDRRGGGGR